MKQIALSGDLGYGMYAIVDDEMFDRCSYFRWRLQRARGKYHNLDYAITSVRVNGRFENLLLHRLIMNTPDSNIAIDHIDHNGLNNQMSNLRLCVDGKNNAMNQSKLGRRTTSRYKGVHYFKTHRKWRATISVGNKRLSLGLYNSETDAALAYNEAAKVHHGEFALLNDIP